MSSYIDDRDTEPELTAEDVDKVVSILMRNFGATADKDTIRSVAISYKGNITRSIAALMKMGGTNTNKTNPSSLQNSQVSQNQKMPQKLTPKKMQKLSLPRDAEISRVIDDINKGYRVLIFMRGFPGSGKSTLARYIIQETIGGNFPEHICSSDDFFYSGGKYRYDVTRLSDAHSWNQEKVCQSIKRHFSPLIVDNTNLELWEMHVYAKTGVANGYRVEVLEPRTPWAYKPADLARKNSHGVSLQVIKRKMEKYQGPVNGNALLNYSNLTYPPGKLPPMMRVLPKVVNFIQDVPVVVPPSIEDKAQASTSKTSPSHNSDFISWDNDNSMNEMTLVNTAAPQKVGMAKFPVNNFSELKNAESAFAANAVTPKSECDFDSYEMLCKISAKSDNRISNPIELNRAAMINNGPVMIVTVQNDIHPSPKPQRISAGSKPSRALERNIPFDNVNWEPIDVSVSNWDYSDKPIPEPNLPSKSDTEVTLPNQIYSATSSTNTQSFDLNPANWDNFRVITAKSKDINFSYVPTAQSLPPTFGLDKGTMTFFDEEISTLEGGAGDRLEQLMQLRKLFPDVPVDDIRHILIKCRGDVNWAVDLLLDDKTERGVMNLMDTDVSTIVENDADLTSFENFDNIMEDPFLKDHAESLQLPVASNHMSPIQNGIKNVKTPKKDRVASESSVILKKQLEENFDFGDDMYSNHVYKLKNKIHKGKNPPKNDETLNNTEEAAECLNKSDERSPSECSDDIEIIEDVISINMGVDFINQMDDIFGTNIKQHEKVEPIVHMPVSLLNQMYALWMESVINQLDVQREFSKAMIKEDEEFARLVESMEQEQMSEGKTPEVPNLQEIMDMEMSLATYKTNVSRWIEETPNNMALTLTRQKLCQLFPDVDKEILIEVLNAHDNDFEQTVQVLLVSLGRIPMSNVSEIDSAAIQNLLVNQERDLLERANQEKEKVMMSFAGPECSSLSDDEVLPEMDQKSTIEYLRRQAERHLVIRNKNLTKAKEYYARGMPHVASYYSHMATLHIKKLEYANNRAAMGILQASSSGRDDYTLDLHYLYVAEAMQALDIFIDNHIARLRDDTNKSRRRFVELFIITGRGKHSPGGIPKIKIATKKRLYERKLKCHDVNWGLVKFTTTSQNMVTDSVPQSVAK